MNDGRIVIFFNRRNILSVIFIAVITAASFIPSLFNGFTNWDDDKLVIENSYIREISPKSITKIFTSFHLGHYNPIVILSFAVEYFIFGLNPFIFHLNNLLLHILNSILVYYLIFLIGKNTTSAFICGILFGIHPLHVESVAWITERKDVLYSFFYLISLVLYVLYLKNKQKNLYLLSSIIFIFSLLTKGLAITLPAILLLIDFFINDKITKKDILNKIPFFILSALFIILALIGTYVSGATKTEHAFAFYDNFFIGNYGILFYIIKSVFPFNLSALYPIPQKINGMLPTIFLISPLAVIIIFSFAAYSVKYTKKGIFGLGLYLLTIFPVLQFIPSGSAVAADRYIYLPLIGLLYIYTELLLFIYKKYMMNVKILKVISLFLLFSIFAVFSIMSYNRCRVWQNSRTLWNDVISKYPQASIAYNNRGSYFFEIGEYKQAEEDFLRAIKLKPDYDRAYYNLGLLYAVKKDYDKAIENYNAAIKINPEYTDAINNLGIIYLKKNMTREAFVCFDNVMRIDKNDATAYNNRGNLYLEMEYYADALADLTRALKAKVVYPEASYNRGIVNLRLKRFKESVNDFNNAIKHKPDYKDAYYNRAIALSSLSKHQEAIMDIDTLLKISPGYSKAYMVRASAYEGLGKYDLALKDFNTSIEKDPGFFENFVNRGIVYVKQGKFEQGIEDFMRAINIKPDYQNAYYNLAVAYFMKKDFDDSLKIVEKMQKLGWNIDSNFLEALNKEIK